MPLRSWSKGRDAFAGSSCLASAPWLDRLSELQLNGNHLKESVAILANRTAPNSWRRLWLQGTFTEFSGGLALLESPGLSNLNELDISDNHKIQASLEKRLRERFGDDSLLEGPKRTIEL